VDFEKAYDRVDWNFLKLTLSEFEFPHSIINLITSWITSPSLSLKWNGEKLDNFKPKRVLRQCDPLSPYLFVLCMKKISLMIQHQVSNDIWKPISISREGPSFSNYCLLMIVFSLLKPRAHKLNWSEMHCKIFVRLQD